jgi:alkylated DNA repair dioxygenase AlkB
VTAVCDRSPAAGLAARYCVDGCDDVLYWPGFVTPTMAERSYAELAAHTEWVEESMRLFGREIPVPRRCAWFGDEGVTYGYSRLLHRARGWSSPVAQLRDRLLAQLDMRFNFVLLNLYRDGNDSMGWPADDEPALGAQPCIASLSLGGARRFCLRARDGSARRVDRILESGSLLLMWGRSQRNWLHAVPRTRRPVAPRINLTFRQVWMTP